MRGAEFFRQLSNFLADLAEMFGQELATLTNKDKATKLSESENETIQTFWLDMVKKCFH
jgi:hypothetical protein